MSEHLWDAHHEYYCGTGNYYDNDCHTHYPAWGAFFAAEGAADMDYNLVFRWDWDTADEGVMGTLTVFWVGQRHATLRSTSVAVHPDEEPLVRAFLQPRMDHLLSLWAPLSPSAAQDDEPEPKAGE